MYTWDFLETTLENQGVNIFYMYHIIKWNNKEDIMSCLKIPINMNFLPTIGGALSTWNKLIFSYLAEILFWQIWKIQTVSMPSSIF